MEPTFLSKKTENNNHNNHNSHHNNYNPTFANFEQKMRKNLIIFSLITKVMLLAFLLSPSLHRFVFFPFLDPSLDFFFFLSFFLYFFISFFQNTNSINIQYKISIIPLFHEWRYVQIYLLISSLHLFNFIFLSSMKNPLPLTPLPPFPPSLRKAPPPLPPPSPPVSPPKMSAYFWWIVQ